jgi:hypothetical protein
MHLPKRDIIATGIVAAAALLYLLWAIDSTLPGMNSTRVTGVAVLTLGFAASASAVVPTFDQLIHGNKTYLAVTSLIGLVGVIAGVQMLVTGSGTSLGVVMAAMAVLWLIATIHHSLLTKTGVPPQQINAPHSTRHGPRPAGARDDPAEAAVQHGSTRAHPKWRIEEHKERRCRRHDPRQVPRGQPVSKQDGRPQPRQGAC